MSRTLAFSALLLLLPAGLSAQADGTARLLARADSLYEAGETDAARAGYEAVLARSPQSSRAAYQLARLLPRGSARGTDLLRRYVRLEPQDAWGWWALAEALAAADRPLAAADAYETAIERGLDADSEALAGERIAALRAGVAPAFEPLTRGTRDSDGNTSLRLGLQADVPVADGLRVGAAGARVTAGDGVASSSALEGTLTLDWEPADGLALDLAAGAARTNGDSLGFAPAVEPLVRLRARWRPESGPAAELRLRREPITSTPLLLASPVVLSEARGLLELPLAGPLRARGLGRVGTLAAPTETNTRAGWGAGPVVRLGPVTEVSALYHRTRWANPTTAGYFAPAQVEAIDAGVYLEYYGAWPFVLALDAGGGGERVTEHGGVAGAWSRSLRLWSMLSWSPRPGRELRLELEAYESLIGDVIAPGAGGWRYGAAGLSFRWATR